MITNIYSDVQRNRVIRGMGDILTDTESTLTRAGYKGVDCKFIPFSGPFSGGTNVCNVDGDSGDYQYGAELISRPGGLDILQAEIRSAPAITAQRDAEWAMIAERNRLLGYTPAAPSTYTGGNIGVIAAPTNAAALIPAVIQTATITTPTGQAAQNPNTSAIQTASPAQTITANGVDLPFVGNVPLWGVIAAGVGLLFLITRGEK